MKQSDLMPYAEFSSREYSVKGVKGGLVPFFSQQKFSAWGEFVWRIGWCGCGNKRKGGQVPFCFCF